MVESISETTNLQKENPKMKQKATVKIAPPIALVVSANLADYIINNWR